MSAAMRLICHHRHNKDAVSLLPLLVVVALLTALALVAPPLLTFTDAAPTSLPLSTSRDCTLDGLGRIGNALRIQDPHQYISSPPLFLSQPGGVGAFTFSMWYRQVIPGKYSQVLLYELAPDLVVSRAPLAFYTYAVASMDLNGALVFSEISGLMDGGWHHILAQWDSASGEVAWFVDGVLAFEQSDVATGTLLPSGGVLSLGQTRYIETFFGTLDEFTFFAAVLPEQDRQTLLQPPTPWFPKDAQLTAAFLARNQAEIIWSFNQPLLAPSGSAQMIVDSSGRGNDASVVCTTHCYASVIVPSTVPGSVGAFSTNWSTVLIPVSTSSDRTYVMQLAHSTLGPSTTHAASALVITSLPAPTLAQLFRVDASFTSTNSSVVGAALAVGDTVLPSEMDASLSSAGLIGVMLRVFASASGGFSSSSSTSFSFDVVPLNSSMSSPTISSLIVLGPNHAPSSAPPPGWASSTSSVVVGASNFIVSLSVDESSLSTFLPRWRRYPSSDYFAADSDGDAVQETSVYITTLPLAGTLFQVNTADGSQGAAILAASEANPVLVTGMSLMYLAPSASASSSSSASASTAATPPLNMTFWLSDGLELSGQAGLFQFVLQALPRLPIMTQVNLSADQDSWSLVNLRMDSSGLAPQDGAYVTLTSLPLYGRLFQVSPTDGTPAAQIGGDASTSAGADTVVSQWMSRILGWSSYYYDVSGSWNVTQILGEPDAFPTYGDNPKAWAGLDTNSAEWIEVGFDRAVYITALEVFETFNPGHVTRILARHPSNGAWQLIWFNNAVGPATPAPDGTANVLSPSLCPVSFPTRDLRIETAPTGYSWVELDAIRVVGTLSTPASDANSLAVLDPAQRVWYAAPRLEKRQDTFSYTANSCRYYERYRQIGVQTRSLNVTLRPVNHAPVAGNITGVATDQLGLALLPALDGSDPDEGDEVHFILRTLPARGLLLLGGRYIGPGDLPLAVQVGARITYRATETCKTERNDDTGASLFAPDSFQYVAHDSALDSNVVSVQVLVYCINPEPLSSSLSNTIRFFCALGVVICLALAGFLIWQREQPIIKASSLFFNLISLTGCIGLYLSLLPLIQTDLNDSWCMARWALPCLSFTLLFSSLFAKTFRIFKIFTNKNFSERVLSNLDLLKFVITGMAIMAVLLLAYGLADPPRPVYSYKLNAQHSVNGGCSNSPLFSGLLLGSQGLLVFAGSYLAVCVRNVPSLFNEGSYIGLTIYNALVLSALAIALDFVMEGNATAQAVVRCFLMVLGLAVAVGTLFVTKVVQLMQIWAIERADDTSTNISQLRKKLRKKYVQRALKAGKTPKEAEAIAALEVDRQVAAASSRKKSMSGLHQNSGAGISLQPMPTMSPGGGVQAPPNSSQAHARGSVGTLGTTAGMLMPSKSVERRLSVPIPQPRVRGGSISGTGGGPMIATPIATPSGGGTRGPLPPLPAASLQQRRPSLPLRLVSTPTGTGGGTGTGTPGGGVSPPALTPAALSSPSALPDPRELDRTQQLEWRSALALYVAALEARIAEGPTSGAGAGAGAAAAASDTNNNNTTTNAPSSNNNILNLGPVSPSQMQPLLRPASSPAAIVAPSNSKPSAAAASSSLLITLEQELARVSSAGSGGSGSNSNSASASASSSALATFSSQGGSALRASSATRRGGTDRPRIRVHIDPATSVGLFASVLPAPPTVATPATPAPAPAAAAAALSEPHVIFHDPTTRSASTSSSQQQLHQFT